MELVVCNGCWQPVKETATRVGCLHLFCSECLDRARGPRGVVCPRCRELSCEEDTIAFQVVTRRIAEEELRDLKASLTTVAMANGARYISKMAAELFSLELAQMQAKFGYARDEGADAFRRLGESEAMRSSDQASARKAFEALHNETDSLREQLTRVTDRNDALSLTLKDRERQLENWKATYAGRGDAASAGGMRRATTPLGLPAEATRVSSPAKGSSGSATLWLQQQPAPSPRTALKPAQQLVHEQAQAQAQAQAQQRLQQEAFSVSPSSARQRPLAHHLGPQPPPPPQQRQQAPPPQQQQQHSGGSYSEHFNIPRGNSYPAPGGRLHTPPTAAGSARALPSNLTHTASGDGSKPAASLNSIFARPPSRRSSSRSDVYASSIFGPTLQQPSEQRGRGPLSYGGVR
jgi:hypothetical protein